MSRIGNKIIPVPAGVKINIKAHEVEVQGPKGKLNVSVPVGISFEQKDGILTAKRSSDDQRALHGLSRALVANAVTGVTTGFKKDLDIVGVGYRAAVQAKNLTLTLGYSHLINYAIPEGVSIETPSQTEIVVKGIDCQRVGQTAAEIRAFRSPEPYKGKGVKYSDEVISLKEAKKK